MAYHNENIYLFCKKEKRKKKKVRIRKFVAIKKEKKGKAA